MKFIPTYVGLAYVMGLGVVTKHTGGFMLEDKPAGGEACGPSVQFTNLLSCTLMATPIAMKVAMSVRIGAR